MIYLSAALALATFASSAFAQDSMNKSDGKMKSDDKMMAGKKNADAKFMMMAAMSDMAEIGVTGDGKVWDGAGSFANCIGQVTNDGKVWDGDGVFANCVGKVESPRITGGGAALLLLIR